MKLDKLLTGLILAFSFLFIFLLVFYGIVLWNQTERLFFAALEGEKNFLESSLNTSTLNSSPPPSLSPQLILNLPPLELSARSAAIVQVFSDNKEKIWFKKNNNLKLPIASLTKLMTAVIVLENYNLNDEIVISKEALSQDERREFLEEGKKMRVSDLLYLMIITSSNKAAYALSEGMDKSNFLYLMNQKAHELNMYDTFFVDVTGLSPDNVSTVDDLIRLARYILANHFDIISISNKKEYEIPGYGKIVNTNELLDQIDNIILGKTGLTEEAKGCLILILNRNNEGYFIYVLLGSDDRFSEMKKMINWVDLIKQKEY